MLRFGHCTVTPADAWSAPPFVLVALPVLLITAQLAAVVGLVMCTCLLPFGARSPKLHVRTFDAMLQPVFEPAASTVQSKPALVGRLSVTITPVAVPAAA